MIGLIGLNEDRGIFYVTAANTTDDLSEEVKGALGGREVGQGKTGVGLHDGNGSEIGEVKTFSDGLGADEDIDVAIFDNIEIFGDSFGFFIVGVKTGDFGGREESF